MVNGHVREKKGYLYVVLSLRKSDGKRGPKWFSTGLKAKGNKRKAEELLQEMRRQYSSLELRGINAFRLPVSDYLAIWSHEIKPKLAPSTYESYRQMLSGTLLPYFQNSKLMLCSLTPLHLEMFYQTLSAKGLSSNTVLRYHAIIHKALNDAVRKEILTSNPAALVERSSKEKFMTTPYSAAEIQKLFEAVKAINWNCS